MTANVIFSNKEIDIRILELQWQKLKIPDNSLVVRNLMEKKKKIA